MMLLSGGLVLGIRYGVEKYLDWQVPSLAYLFLMVIALVLVRNSLKYSPPRWKSESKTEKDND
jgi:hypothetical protein